MSKHDYAHRRNDIECRGARMSAHRLIRYSFGGTSIVSFDAYGRSVLRGRKFFGLRLLGTTPNEEVGTTVSVLLRSRGLGRSSVQSRDSESRRLAICIAGGESQGSTQATLELFLLPDLRSQTKK